MLKLEITLNDECQALLETRAKNDKVVTEASDGSETRTPRFTVSQLIQNALFQSLGLQIIASQDEETAKMEKQRADLDAQISQRKISVIAVDAKAV